MGLKAARHLGSDIWTFERGERARVMVGRDGWAWSASFGAMGSELRPFLAECDSEYLARKFETPQHETDWDKVSADAGFQIDVTTAWDYEDALRQQYGEHWWESLPHKETTRFRAARLAAEELIDWARSG